MTYREFVRGLRIAYEHRGGLKMFACGKIEDPWFDQIRKEVTWIISSQVSSDVTASSHVTYWTRPTGIARQFSLLNSSGRTDDFASDHSFALEGKKFVFPELTGIQRFAALFGSQLINLRLNGLGSNSGLGAHEEQSISPMLSNVRYKIRFHLPIFSNPEVRICLDEEQFRFEEGVLYFFNQGCVHAAINKSTEPRYHFVLDCLLTKELHRNILSLTGKSHSDPGFIPFTAEDAQRYYKPEPWKIEDFATEGGAIISAGIRYDRKAPTIIDYYRSNHPAVFSTIDRLTRRRRRLADAG